VNYRLTDALTFSRKMSVAEAAAEAEEATQCGGLKFARITSHTGREAFVITEGPKELLVEDFWRLVWQEEVENIIMLTRTFEFIKIMCVQYWPMLLDKREAYGAFGVTIVSEEPHAHYRIRKLDVDFQDQRRRVTHYHYHEWPQYAPPAPNSLLQFRRRFLSDQQNQEEAGALPRAIVHCSDGGSRSGMFVALMDCLDMNNALGRVDVYGTVRRMISQRKALITEPSHLQ
jgi:protein tyrosine phosphatase